MPTRSSAKRNGNQDPIGVFRKTRSIETCAPRMRSFWRKIVSQFATWIAFCLRNS